MMWLIYLAAAILLLVFVRLYIASTWVMCQSQADLTGKTVIITGGNTGIGFTTALDLAKRNARVILACRRQAAGEEACDRIMKMSGNKNVVFRILDLSSLKSVRDFANNIIKTESRLDILINNAGIAFAPPGQKTNDGLHLVMASNHFGHFLLTNLLLDLLKKSAPARIVVVSSIAHKMAGKMDPSNLNFQLSEVGRRVYGTTKLANIMFTLELSRRLDGTGVTVNCLHPGSIRTELLRTVPSVFRIFFGAFAFFFFRSPTQGSQTSIYCAVSEEMEGVSGQYLSECKFAPLADHVKDPETCRRVWQESCKFTGLPP